MTKRCRHCREEKPLVAFNKCASCKDGLRYECRVCSAVYAAAYRKANPDKIQVRGAAYHKANAERINARSRAWHKANPEKMKAHRLAWRKAHPAKANACRTAWQKANPDKSKTLTHRRRARQRGALGSHTTAEWLARVAEFGGCCAYCLTSTPLTRDHLVPLVHGGTNNIGNIVPACLSCNRSKNAKTGLEFIAWCFRRAA